MTAPETLTRMATFLRVVELGSFSAAARALGRTPSSVSRQVGELEARLGVRLLHRTTRKLAPTEAGAALQAGAGAAMAALEEAERAVRDLSTAPRGLLRISAPLVLAQLHVAPGLTDFCRRYPELRLELETSDRVVDLVEEGYDLALRVGTPQESNLVARRLAPFTWVTCAAPAYLAEAGEPREPADLTEHRCLAMTRQRETWAFERDGRPLLQPVTPVLWSNHADLLRRTAVDGLGIARLAAFAVGDDLRSGRLRPVLTDFQPRGGGIFALWPSNRHLSPKVRVFVDHLAASLGRPAYWQEKGLA